MGRIALDRRSRPDGQKPQSTRGSVLLALWLAFASCGGEATPPEARAREGQPPLPSCSGDNNGIIEPGELDFSPGRSVPYAVQGEGDRPVAPQGDPALGKGLWDFRDATFDRLEEVPMLDPRDLWCADRVPGASLALRFVPEEEGLDPAYMIMRAGEDELEILAVASVEPEDQLLLYDRAVALMRFPMELGQSWSAAVSPVEGSFFNEIHDLDKLGIEHRYSFQVTGQGTLHLPGLSIENVLELTMTLEQTLQDDLLRTRTETYLVHECLGTVARRTGASGPWWVVWYPT